MKLSNVAKAVVALAAGAVVSSSAMADTYLMVINATPGTIQVNGQAVAPKGGAWSALDAVVVTQAGGTFQLKDNHARCNGGWQISASGPTNANFCEPLGIGEIGCLYASIERPKGSPAPKVEFYKVALGVCSNAWYQANKTVINDIADKVLNGAATLATAVAASG